MAEYQEIKESPSYRTLDEIRLRKSQLLVDITKDGNKVEKLWNNLFHKSPDKGKKTAGRRMSSIVSTGASVVDGLI
ncbi:MAG: hypothetical protein PUG12_07125, partial [Prevotella sp.]|nr:hypothetical protein [Prevotella sp.]